jgi:hypothetical protein
MTWQNPWVWAGALLAGVPVLIHLLSRSSARPQRFPTLRFFDDTRIMAVRRSRITDVPLLLLRMLIIVAAVAALAQPYLPTGEREARLAQRVSRVVLVDTSASMQRQTPAGGTALAAARAAASSYDDGVTTIVETAAPGAALAGAASVLATRSGVREVVVVSDFQAGAIDSVDLAAVPDGTGVTLHRISAAAAAPAEWRTQVGSRLVHAQPGAVVEWQQRRLPADSVQPAVRALAGDAGRARAAAVVAAGLADVPAPPPQRPILLLLPDYPQRDAVLAAAAPLTTPWMADAVAAMLRDDVLAAAAAAAGVPPLQPAQDMDVAALSGSATALAVAAAHEDALLLVAAPAADGLALAALVAAAARGAAPASFLRELEPGFVPDDALQRWQRPAVPAAAGADIDISDGRWLWLAVLLLLGAETWLRRRAGIQRTADGVQRKEGGVQRGEGG